MTTTQTVPAALERAASSFGDTEAVVDGTVRWTFAQLYAESLRVASALAASGVRRGDRVALWSPNSARWVAASFGVYAAGAVLVPVNTRFKGLDEALLATAKERFGVVAPYGGPTSSGMMTLHCPPAQVHPLATFLRQHGAETVVVAELDYVFARDNPLYEKLAAKI